jgi:hypothetical protein
MEFNSFELADIAQMFATDSGALDLITFRCVSVSLRKICDATIREHLLESKVQFARGYDPNPVGWEEWDFISRLCGRPALFHPDFGIVEWYNPILREGKVVYCGNWWWRRACGTFGCFLAHRSERDSHGMTLPAGIEADGTRVWAQNGIVFRDDRDADGELLPAIIGNINDDWNSEGNHGPDICFLACKPRINCFNADILYSLGFRTRMFRFGCLWAGPWCKGWGAI